MKYVLGFLFEYKYYKNPANVRIFANDQLIDEFDLTEDINLKNIQPPTADDNKHLYDFYKKWTTLENENAFGEGWNNQTLQHLQVPEKAFVYTLDESVIKNSIRIEVKNDNTNYTNGFMTKWSSFKFHNIFLLPEKFLNVENYIAFGEEQIQIRKKVRNDSAYHTTINPHNLVWPDEAGIVKDGKISYDLSFDELWSLKEKGGSFSIELPIIEYVHDKSLKIIGPKHYEQLENKQKRRLITNSRWPFYFYQYGLINTKNETT